MGKVLLDITMSLDRFIAVPNDDVERLHDCVFDGKTERTETSPRTSATCSNREVLDESFKTTGAVVTTRRRYPLVRPFRH
jgi:hypothetical protein